MRLAVCSDGHGVWESAAGRLAAEKVDGVVYLGDRVSDGENVARILGVPLWCVRGNCDLSYTYDSERVIEPEGVRILLCHGDRHQVKSGLWRLSYRAEELGCRVVLFGHTHIWCDVEDHGVRLCNPGSMGKARDGACSVGILTLDKGEVVEFRRIFV